MATSATRSMFVSGQPVEYWTDPEIRFGLAPEDLQRYADGDDWVLLFNAVMLMVPGQDPEYAS